MSRVHDALRKAEITVTPPVAPAAPGTAPEAAPAGPAFGPPTASAAVQAPPESLGIPQPPVRTSAPSAVPTSEELRSLLETIETIPFTPSPDASLLDASRPSEAPAEEFRSLRTRLNHMQSLQPIHSLVVTSASPAEGKSFTAANLALAQSHLEGNMVLLADFDFRRPVVHNLFQVSRAPGITDYLQGKATLEQIIKHVEGTNLYIIPAGEAVLNPLELLNLPEVKQLLDRLPRLFNWVILDTPPLLFAADANLLSTLTQGLILVVRMGSTTIDSVTRAMGSLCQNNMLGVVVNGANKGELYSKYTYYHSYYYTKPD
jgi:receptor protein-tyrosine kinase